MCNLDITTCAWKQANAIECRIHEDYDVMRLIQPDEAQLQAPDQGLGYSLPCLTRIRCLVFVEARIVQPCASTYFPDECYTQLTTELCTPPFEQERLL